VSAIGSLLPGLSMQEALAFVLLPVVGSTVLICLFLCLRRFDVEEGSDGDDGGGGERRPPPPDSPPPLVFFEPPLGEIRTSGGQLGARPARERRERETAPPDGSHART
jgi:hypothetical protein